MPIIQGNLSERFQNTVVRAFKGLLIQNRYAVDAGNCVYKSEDGCLKCVVGQLITDENYTKELENSTIQEDIVKKAVENSIGYGLTPNETSVLHLFQTVHDSGNNTPLEFGSSMYEQLKEKIPKAIEHYYTNTGKANGLLLKLLDKANQEFIDEAHNS